MLPTLAQISSLGSPLEVDVAEYAAGACRSIELWLGKVDEYLGRHSVGDLRRLLEEHEVVAPVASFQGGLFAKESDAQCEHWAGFAERLALLHELGVQTLVVAGDIAGPLSGDDVPRACALLSKAAREAAEQGVRLALEFQARAALANNLESALALIAEAAQPNLGICLDAFHFHTGPSKHDDLAHLSSENLFHVQLCDISGVPRELATDADRILPGDGDVGLTPIVERLRAIGYSGTVSVELMNPQIWRVPPRQFGEIAMTALRKTLGLAAME